MEASCINYKDTGFFSSTLVNYLENAPDLHSFYNQRPDLEGFAQLFNHKNVTTNRALLAEVLTSQYQSVFEVDPQYAKLVNKNISLLKKENTFTITTGHQLNIFAGPLYFIYKIVTAIKLSRQLKDAFPDKNFVPVYWMATEDHDFAEINHTNIGGKKVAWQLDAKGATGRLDTKTIRQALNQYKGVLGIEANAPELATIVETAYTKFNTLASATRYLVNALFGRYGLVIIDADHPKLKTEFARYIEQDITGQHSFKHITETNNLLQSIGVHIQVNPREINFFYLLDNLRERITFENDRYYVLNTDISFDQDELKAEITQYPERFSPNVAMRPLYQEVILPNIAYIGGGAEIVYWLELKSTFDHYNVTYPILILRNSGLIVPQDAYARITKMGLTAADFFKPVDEVKNYWIKKNSEHQLTFDDEWKQLAPIFRQMKQHAEAIDPTLGPSTEAIQARLKRAVNNLEKKLVRAEKRNHITRINQIEQLKQTLFPSNGLQERTENFGLFYVKWGQTLIDELIRNFQPLDFVFNILTC